MMRPLSAFARDVEDAQRVGQLAPEAGAVVAEQSHDLAAVHVEIDAPTANTRP
jgi:hypothetical protein